MISRNWKQECGRASLRCVSEGLSLSLCSLISSVAFLAWASKDTAASFIITQVVLCHGFTPAHISYAMPYFSIQINNQNANLWKTSITNFKLLLKITRKFKIFGHSAFDLKKLNVKSYTIKLRNRTMAIKEQVTHSYPFFLKWPTFGP